MPTNQELIAKAARDLLNARYAIALTGAGISTESGISDFRGPDGIWTKNPDAERRAYEMYGEFLTDPKQFWLDSLNSPGILGDLSSVSPNPGHYALAKMEQMKIIKCLITQNVDNLHQRAGHQKVLDYHGNAFRLRCVECNARYSMEEYDLQQLKETDKLPPRCKKCNGIVKTDAVYFQEAIPSDVAEQSVEEATQCDVMLICGTSAVVYPFANLPVVAKQKTTSRVYPGLYTPQSTSNTTIIEVNGEMTPLTREGISDYFIKGKTGEILPALVGELERLVTTSR